MKRPLITSERQKRRLILKCLVPVSFSKIWVLFLAFTCTKVSRLQSGQEAAGCSQGPCQAPSYSQGRAWHSCRRGAVVFSQSVSFTAAAAGAALGPGCSGISSYPIAWFPSKAPHSLGALLFVFPAWLPDASPIHPNAMFLTISSPFSDDPVWRASSGSALPGPI